MSRKLSKQASELIAKYGLIDDPNDPSNSDVFHSSRFSIITRGGIDKISSQANINSELEVVYSSPSEVVVKGTYGMGDRVVTTLGESSVDEYNIAKVSESSFNKGALGLIRDAAVALREGKIVSKEEGVEDKTLDENQANTFEAILLSLSGLNGLETKESIVRTLTRKGNVTSTNSKGDPIPNYRWAMAEKRANSRGVLKLVGLYDEGFFGEEEADDFKDLVAKESKKASSSKSVASKVVSDSIKIE